MTDPTSRLKPPTATFDGAKNNLARNLAAARGVIGLSQEQLGHISGVSRATINQIEGAEGDPRLSTITNLASALEIPNMLLVAGREEFASFVQAVESTTFKRVKSSFKTDDLEAMNYLIDSGISKNRTKAIEIAAKATMEMGFATIPAIVAVGSILLPGIGTALGAAMAATSLLKIVKMKN